MLIFGWQKSTLIHSYYLLFSCVYNMNLYRRKQWFTLLEVIVVMVVFFMLITTVSSLFIHLYKIKGWLEARQTVTQDTYFLLEKLQTMMKDYTVDYEEYWNRKVVWCTSLDWEPWDPRWNENWNCTKFTSYGNYNNNIYGEGPAASPHPTFFHILFYCSSIEDALVKPTNSSETAVYDIYNNKDALWMNCTKQTRWQLYQAYGQYRNLFTDVKEDVDFVLWAAKDDDDEDMGDGPEAVYQTATNYPQELYLISHDKQRRMFIRRVCETGEDMNGDNVISKSEQLCKLQVLQLKGFDAGYNHDFDINNSQGVYDWVIDTWACDYSMGFVCRGPSIEWAFPNYNLPDWVNDGWKDLLGSNITISDRKLKILPLKDPNLARNDSSSQLSPYVIVSLTSQLYAKNWRGKLTLDQMNGFTLPIQTQFSFSIQ